MKPCLVCAFLILSLGAVANFIFCSRTVFYDWFKVFQVPQSDPYPCGYLTGPMLGRLGSQMNMYSTLMGLAAANRKRLIVPLKGSNNMRDAFDGLTAEFYNSSEQGKEFDWVKMGAKGTYIFTSKLMHLPCKKNVSLIKETVGWKYYASVRNNVAKEFKFKNEVLKPCLEKLSKITRRFKKPCIFVGAHLRRGDFVQKARQLHGHQPAKDEFLAKAVRYYQERFSSVCIHFVVLGNDYNWNKKVAQGLKDVHVLKPSTPAQDMCILSHCNHSIISAGSFGRESAILTGGIVVYQKEQYQTKSTIAKNSQILDVIPPGWISV